MYTNNINVHEICIHKNFYLTMKSEQHIYTKIVKYAPIRNVVMSYKGTCVQHLILLLTMPRTNTSTES